MSAGTAAIRTRALLACEPFGARLPAPRVADALAAGLTAGGRPEPDLVELPPGADDHRVAEVLADEGFHARMLASRAVIVAVPVLSERTLAGSATFEVATLARQNGVPCYAVAARLELNEFDLRILDLQLVLEAGSPTSLARAGERLAQVV